MTSLHQAAPGRNRNATDRKAVLRRQIDASLDTLANAVDSVRASDDFRRCLDTQARFHNYSWHAASEYLRADGQRYIWKFAYGRADHYWEGVTHYTHAGRNPHFCEFIAGLSAADRQLFRLPPPDHAYYTRQTLADLEEQYPGWNAGGEYRPGDGDHDR